MIQYLAERMSRNSVTAGDIVVALLVHTVYTAVCTVEETHQKTFNPLFFYTPTTNQNTKKSLKRPLCAVVVTKAVGFTYHMLFVPLGKNSAI